MELLIIFFLGMIFIAGLLTVSVGVFRLLFFVLGCLLVLPVILAAFVVFTAFASALLLPALFLAGFIMLVAGLVKLIT